MIAKIIMFFSEMLLNLRFVIDEITMFITNLGAFAPYVAFKAFLNAIRYDDMTRNEKR